MIRKMNNYDLLNKIGSGELDANTIKNMKTTIKNCLIENDELHSAVFQSERISDHHEIIDLTEKLLVLSENTGDFFTAITIFSDTYCNKMNGMTANEPTKIVGFLRREISSLKSQIETEKENSYDHSTVVGSAIGCIGIIQQELEKKKKANENKSKSNQLRIETKRDLIISYVEYLIQRLNIFKNLMDSYAGQEYYENFAKEFPNMTADQLKKQDSQILSVAFKYYRYVLKEVKQI